MRFRRASASFPAAASADAAAAPIGDEAENGDGVLVNSRFLDGMEVEEAKAAVIARAEGDATPRCGQLPASP